MCAEIMILEFKPEIIINTGVAGAISKELEITDVVISTSLYEYDLDITPLGYPLGFISGADIVEIPSDSSILDDLIKCSQKALKKPAKTGVIVSGDRFVNDNQLKEFLSEKFNASACEMEGAAIGHVCYMNKVPFSVVRAISDNAEGTADMDFETFSRIAAENSVKLMLEYLSM
jgi:adenosylhomocysteine nucleosidase